MLALFLASPWPLFALCVAVAAVGARELGRMVDDKPVWVFLWGLPAFALLAGWLLVSARFPRWELQWFFVIQQVLFAVGIAATAVWVRKRRSGHLPIGLWLTAPLASVVALHGVKVPHDPVWYPTTPVLMACVPIWIGDVLAYLVGKRIGRHKLAATISPKKTWEGAIANLVGCLVASWAIGQAIGFPTVPSLWCGLVCGTLGQAGDLFESWVKRTAGRKDSGSLLPGHGGILDRIDSVLAAAPTIALILNAWLD